MPLRLGRKRRRDDDFREEIDAHLALEVDRLVAEGTDPDEARARSRRIFGNTARVQEHFYESRRVLWLDALLRDMRYAVRGIHRNPGVSALVILTLALGRARLGRRRVLVGGRSWAGRDAMRISVSSWRTTEGDIDRSAESIVRAHRAVYAGR
jgi:hypothetical protein